jgi:hypothetical protein
MILLLVARATIEPPLQPGFLFEGVWMGVGEFCLLMGNSPAQPAQPGGAVEAFNGASHPSMEFMLIFYCLYCSFVTGTKGWLKSPTWPQGGGRNHPQTTTGGGFGHPLGSMGVPKGVGRTHPQFFSLFFFFFSEFFEIFFKK